MDRYIKFGLSILLLALTSCAVADIPIPTDTATTTGTTTNTKSIDITHLPLGDVYFTSVAPQLGYAYLCSTVGANRGFGNAGPWFNADGTTWDYTTKIAVQGSVVWSSSFTSTLNNMFLVISANGLPTHSTGTYPVARADPAYQYDKNPNAILSQNLDWRIPANPQLAASPGCLPMGSIGILLTGAALFNPADADIRDGVAWEVQDACEGHPTGMMGGNIYHYHNVSRCVEQDTAGQHSPLVGYIADGFGIYGNLGEGGVALTNASLDECHGHTHIITINSLQTSQYHYHKTLEFPYAVGCFKGTPVVLRNR